MTVATRINPPEGYTRVYAAEDSLGTFLRNYAVRADGAQVLYYNGEIREDAQAAPCWTSALAPATTRARPAPWRA